MTKNQVKEKEEERFVARRTLQRVFNMTYGSILFPCADCTFIHSLFVFVFSNIAILYRGLVTEVLLHRKISISLHPQREAISYPPTSTRTHHASMFPELSLPLTALMRVNVGETEQKAQLFTVMDRLYQGSACTRVDFLYCNEMSSNEPIRQPENKMLFGK